MIVNLPMWTVDVRHLKFVSSKMCPHSQHIILEFQQHSDKYIPLVDVSKGTPPGTQGIAQGLYGPQAGVQAAQERRHGMS